MLSYLARDGAGCVFARLGRRWRPDGTLRTVPGKAESPDRRQWNLPCFGRPSHPVTRFTTDAVRPQDGHDAGASRDWPTIGPVFRARPPGAVHDRSDGCPLGAMGCISRRWRVGIMSVAPQRQRDGFDQLTVGIILTGSAQGGPNGLASAPATACPAVATSRNRRFIIERSPNRQSGGTTARHGPWALDVRRPTAFRLNRGDRATPERSVLDLLSVALPGRAQRRRPRGRQATPRRDPRRIASMPRRRGHRRHGLRRAAPAMPWAIAALISRGSSCPAKTTRSRLCGHLP